jgi:hypothetical protein
MDQQPAGIAFDMDSEEAALTAAALVRLSPAAGKPRKDLALLLVSFVVMFL